MAYRDKPLLIVDDTAANVELILDLLEDEGFTHVEGITDPREVLSFCEAGLPSLILLDIRMPHLDGYGVIEQLQERFSGQVPPIIILTAQVDDATRQRALSMGVRDFITKPFKHDEVLQRVQNALEVENRYQVRSQQAEVLERLVAKRTRALERLSRLDPGTGLPNRRSLLSQLRRRARTAKPTGVVFIMLDNLDAIGQLHGHASAEQFLTFLSQRLKTVMGANDDLGLWGGSALLMIVDVEDLNDEAATRLVQRLYSVLSGHHRLNQLLLSVSPRMGLSHAKLPFDAERLVQQASLAKPPLGVVPCWQCYSLALETAHQHRHQLQQALSGAIDYQQFTLAYQPKISLATQKIVGVEALLRWEHPDHGAISPGVFIPLAEASGDILAIGDWVLDEAICQAALWRATHHLDEQFHIAVNVAAQQFIQDDFAQQLLTKLTQAELPSRMLSVEVTESGLMQDVLQAQKQLKQLQAAGIKIAIDDFGTGYSSLAYLKTLPFDTLKIDRSFIQELPNAQADQQLANTVIALAKGFGCSVVAEGIEEAAQGDWLDAHGCEFAQGFYYDRPLSAEVLARRYFSSTDPATK